MSELSIRTASRSSGFGATANRASVAVRAEVARSHAAAADVRVALVRASGAESARVARERADVGVCAVAANARVALPLAAEADHP